MSLKNKLDSLPFKTEVENAGGIIYAVGGAVRDELIGIESKDLDILVCRLPQSELTEILKKYGRVDEVGESFGVTKFRAPGGDEIDIALPRTEKKTGEGHKDFTVVSDPNLPIAEDLKRRDFTINAIALDTNGNYIDPYNGRRDLDQEIIRLVNDNAFEEDPLRMLRAVQFAARLNFTIHQHTHKSMIANAHLITTVSKERVVIEFEKIAKKGSHEYALSLLVDTGLYQNIFRESCPEVGIYDIDVNCVDTLGELLYYLTGFSENTSDLCKNHLHCDTNTIRETHALHLLHVGIHNEDRLMMFKAFKIYPDVIKSRMFEHNGPDLWLFRDGTLPKSMAEIDCDGYTLISLGLRGVNISAMYALIIAAILEEVIENKKEQIVEFVKRNL